MRDRHRHILDLSSLVEVATFEPHRRSELVSKLGDRATDPRATVELAQWLGILTPDYELADLGVVLQWVRQMEGESDSLSPEGGEDSTGSAYGVRTLLTWLLIRADALTAAIVAEIDSERSVPSADLLRSSFERLIAAARANASSDQLVPALEISELAREWTTNSRLATEAVATRYQLLETLTLLKRSDTAHNEPKWDSTPRLDSMRVGLRSETLSRSGIQEFLDRRFFANLASGQPPIDLRESRPTTILSWVAQAFRAIQRPLGFTPGRPLALATCLLANKQSYYLEIDTVYDVVYAAADSIWSNYLHFSGGSRFDREFLIRIDPRLEAELASGSSASLL